MAGNRIKGITVEINGETKGLSSALDGVNKKIKDTTSNLKDVERLLKLNPGNTELLKQKQAYLADAISETKEKLDQEKEALRQLQEAGNSDETIEMQRALEREIASTEQSLKKLTDEANKTNVVFEKIGVTAQKVADGAKAVADKTKAMSAAAGGALAGLVGLGVKAAKDADELATLSKQTGISTTELQKMQYASELVDVSVEDIVGASKKMKAQIKSGSAIFDKLGVSVKDSNGKFRDTNDIFNDCIIALGMIKDETQRDITSMELFGKSADSLAGIIDDGGKALRELGAEAEQKGLIISEEDIESANELNDTLYELKATLGGSFGKAAISVVQVLTPLIQGLADKIGSVAEKLQNVSPTTIKIVSIILAIIGAISPIAGIISSIATVISVLMPILAAFNAVLLANPIVLIVMAIVAAIAALIAIGVLLYKNWDTIKAKAEELKDKLSAKFEEIKNKVSEKIQALKDAIRNKFEEIKNNIINKAVEIKTNFVNKIAEMKSAVADKFQEIKQAISDKIKEIVQNALSWGKDIIQGLIDGIRNKIKEVKDAAEDIAKAIWEKLHFSEPENGPLADFHTYMPDMIAMMVKGLNEGVDELSAPMSRIASALIPDPNAIYAGSREQSNGLLSSIDRTLGSYFANPGVNETNVNVVLEGDAARLFRVMQQQSVAYTRTTGRSAF